MVYFISDGENVKIGYSKNPKKRLLDLQVSSARKLVLLGTIEGDRGVEQQIHADFAHLLVNGEWFRTDPTFILHYIKSAKFPFHRGKTARSEQTIAQALRYYRNSLNKSQAEVAKQACIRQATVSKAEKGLKSTEIGTIYQICYALGLELIVRPRASKPFNPEDFT